MLKVRPSWTENERWLAENIRPVAKQPRNHSAQSAFRHVQVVSVPGGPGTGISLLMRPEGYVQPEPAPIAYPRTVDVLDVPLALIDYATTISWMDSMIAER